MESYESDICCFRAMTLSPLHLVVNWPDFNIYISVIYLDPHFYCQIFQQCEIKYLKLFTENRKVISSYLFEVFRALVRSVEWSGVSGVVSPGSVGLLGPPLRQRSHQCASCADVRYRVLVQWTPVVHNHF